MGNNPVVDARGTHGQVAPSARGEERGLSAAVGHRVQRPVSRAAPAPPRDHPQPPRRRGSLKGSTSWQCARLRQRR